MDVPMRMVGGRGVSRRLAGWSGLLFVGVHLSHGLGGEGDSRRFGFERMAVECDVGSAERVFGSI